MCSLNQLLTLCSGGSAGFIHAYKLANTPDPGQVVNVVRLLVVSFVSQPLMYLCVTARVCRVRQN
jgi:hypothetical protein